MAAGFNDIIHKMIRKRPYIVREISSDERLGKRDIDNVSDPPARCNMCGKALDELDLKENFGFDYFVGYGSRHDEEHVRARFCCECFDTILDTLTSECVISPIVGEYDAFRNTYFVGGKSNG